MPVDSTRSIHRPSTSSHIWYLMLCFREGDRNNVSEDFVQDPTLPHKGFRTHKVKIEFVTSFCEKLICHTKIDMPYIVSWQLSIGHTPWPIDACALRPCNCLSPHISVNSSISHIHIREGWGRQLLESECWSIQYDRALAFNPQSFNQAILLKVQTIATHLLALLHCCAFLYKTGKSNSR